SGTGTLTKTDTGTLTVSRVRLGGNAGGTLNVSGGKLVLAPSVSAANTSIVNGFSLTAGTQLDLTNNHLIARATPVGPPGSGNTYPGVSGMIQSGRNGGTWNGPGIITSQTDALNASFTSIAVASAADVKAIAATATASWAGQTVTGSNTLV